MVLSFKPQILNNDLDTLINYESLARSEACNPLAFKT